MDSFPNDEQSLASTVNVAGNYPPLRQSPEAADPPSMPELATCNLEQSRQHIYAVRLRINIVSGFPGSEINNGT